MPTCGWAMYKMSSGAPQAWSVCSTRAMCGLLMPVVSLPSENAPAPPSPNCTLLSPSSAPPAQKVSTSRARSSTRLPRSNTTGRAPASARASAANSPAGPSPITAGRARHSCRGRGAMGVSLASCAPGTRRRVSTSSEYTKCTSPRSRASTDFLRTRTRSTSPSAIFSARAATRASGASSPADTLFTRYIIFALPPRFPPASRWPRPIASCSRRSRRPHSRFRPPRTGRAPCATAACAGRNRAYPARRPSPARWRSPRCPARAAATRKAAPPARLAPPPRASPPARKRGDARVFEQHLAQPLGHEPGEKILQRTAGKPFAPRAQKARPSSGRAHTAISARRFSASA